MWWRTQKGTHRSIHTFVHTHQGDVVEEQVDRDEEVHTHTHTTHAPGDVVEEQVDRDEEQHRVDELDRLVPVVLLWRGAWVVCGYVWCGGVW